MALITRLAIEESASMELADGGCYGDSYFGRQVLDAARELLEQAEQPKDPLPLCESTSAKKIWGAAVFA